MAKTSRQIQKGPIIPKWIDDPVGSGNSGDYGVDIPFGKVKALPEGGQQAIYIAVGANDVSTNESEVYSQ